jgi:hypothetical protein
MRPILAASIVVLASACSLFRYSPADKSDSTVPTNQATTLEIARTQLQHHGFTVQDLGGGVLVTSPRRIEAHQRDSTEGSASSQGDMWFVRVLVEPASFTAGSSLRLWGFVVPKTSTQTGAQRVDAIPIGTRDKLYADVRAAAGWIFDEASRKGPRQSGGERPQ